MQLVTERAKMRIIVQTICVVTSVIHLGIYFQCKLYVVVSMNVLFDLSITGH